MRLTDLHIEAFRGIPRLDLSFDAVTVVIGENNHGKSSVFDVLGLCLARRDDAAGSRFREDDFFRVGTHVDRPIKLVLTFTEVTGADMASHRDFLAIAREPDDDGRFRVRAEFTGRHEDRLIHRRFVAADGTPLDPQPPPSLFKSLQKLHPVLLLRLAQPYQGPRPADATSPGGSERRGRRSLEALITRVYHDLTRARGPLPAGEIEYGLRAAKRLFAGRDASRTEDAPLHRMLREILSDSASWGHGDAHGDRFRVRAGSGAHTVGLLLVLGAMLEERGEETLPETANPIIAIEEPAAHLHPILLASTWDVIEALGTQTVVTTNSGELLSSVPMKSLRRLQRTAQRIEARQLGERTLTEADVRRLSYHVRTKRGGVLFARCWLLVEGESEFWLMSHLAHVLGYDLEAEGVRCVEFAQCGVPPLVKLANDLGIEWHILADGDESGETYAREASRHLGGRSIEHRVARLEQPDIERYLWHHGFDGVYREAANIAGHFQEGDSLWPPGRVISKAVRKKSKPYLALMVADACADRGPDSIPGVLRSVIETSVALARQSVAEAQ